MANLTEVPPRDQEIDVFGLSHVGKVREENEDRFLVASLHKMMKVWDSSFPADHLRGLTSDSIAFLMMVADGVGGQAAGEKASETALEAVAQYVALTVNAYYNLDTKMEDAFLKDLEVSVQR